MTEKQHTPDERTLASARLSAFCAGLKITTSLALALFCAYLAVIHWPNDGGAYEFVEASFFCTLFFANAYRIYHRARRATHC